MKKTRNQIYNKNIKNHKFGRLTAIEPTKERDCGYVVWKCKCGCGKTVYLSTSKLSYYKSCGCLKEERNSHINETLDFVDGTCIQWIEKRKYRSDNKSGYRGVFFSVKDGKWKVSIGFQGKRKHIGTFCTYEEAVDARLKAEEEIYHPFIQKFYKSKKSKILSAS